MLRSLVRVSTSLIGESTKLVDVRTKLGGPAAKLVDASMRFVDTPMSLVDTRLSFVDRRSSVLDTPLGEICALLALVAARLQFAVTDKALTIARHKERAAPFDDEDDALCRMPGGSDRRVRRPMLDVRESPSGSRTVR